ncbi:MAG TPA: 2Fe-2S iron-sulfur cluster binding domain-containing protein [Ignavibacteria bacterium]|nr:2Fe-2S iron-sulfur cluster binding domain-containing protein [Ignavibacteria bacterium]
MEKKISFIINDTELTVKVNPNVVLLDFLRKELHLTGTKEGCKEGDCGACTVLVGRLDNGKIIYLTVTSCLYAMGNTEGKHIVTIEGLNQNELTMPQKEFVDEGASQCGFCTPGFIVSLTGYFLNHNSFSFNEAVNALGGNICRCTGYTSIKRAVKKSIDIQSFNLNGENNHLKSLIDNNIIPKYFSTILNRLKLIAHRPESKKQIVDGEKILINGGTDLFVQKPDELLNEETIFISEQESKYIEEKEGKIIIGAAATFEMIKKSEIMQKYFNNIESYLNLVASQQIRNSATIAGNIVNASPIGDMTVFLLSLNSTVILNNGNSKREIYLKDFYKGYKTIDKKANEIIEQIRFDVPDEHFNFNFEKVSKRTHLDIASVNTAIGISVLEGIICDIHISAGGIAPIPLYLNRTSKYLLSKELNTANIDKALKIAQEEISPISDVRGSADYKRFLLNQLIKSHFLVLFPGKFNIEELV